METMLRAEEARKIASEYPARKINANLCGILEIVRGAAESGRTSTEVEIPGIYQEETIEELKKLGYALSEPLRYKVSSVFYTISWK